MKVEKGSMILITFYIGKHYSETKRQGAFSITGASGSHSNYWAHTFEDKAERWIEINAVITALEHLKNRSESCVNVYSNFDFSKSNSIDAGDVYSGTLSYYEHCRNLIDECYDISFQYVNTTDICPMLDHAVRKACQLYESTFIVKSDQEWDKDDPFQ